MAIYRDITTNGISETMILDLIVDLFTIVLDEEEASKAVCIINTLKACFHKKFEEIDENFFILMKVTPEQAKGIMVLLKDFKVALENP
jgi:hypothetical protein